MLLALIGFGKVLFAGSSSIDGLGDDGLATHSRLRLAALFRMSAPLLSDVNKNAPKMENTEPHDLNMDFLELDGVWEREANQSFRVLYTPLNYSEERKCRNTFSDKTKLEACFSNSPIRLHMSASMLKSKPVTFVSPPTGIMLIMSCS